MHRNIGGRGGIMKFPDCSLEGYPPVCAVIYFLCQEPGQPGLVLPHGPQHQLSAKKRGTRAGHKTWSALHSYTLGRNGAACRKVFTCTLTGGFKESKVKKIKNYLLIVISIGDLHY